MKSRWEYLEFEDCIDKIVYTNKIKRKDFLIKGKYRIISQEEKYINGFWNTESDLFKIKKPVVTFGDHTKNIKYIDFDFVLGADGVKIFQPIDDINTKYFYYFLRSVKLKDLGYARHYRLLKEIKVPFPPLPEQKRIVKILDEAFTAINKAKANAEKNLQNSRELFDSYLNKVFANPGEDWEEKLMSDLFDITSSKRVFKADWKREGVPFYRAREVVKLAVNGTVNNELFISEEMYKEYSSKYGIPQAGDIMITGVGTLGKCYLVKPSDKFYFKDGNIIWLKKKTDVNSRFVEYAYKSDYLKKQITDNSMGATVGTYTIIRAKQTKVPIPPLPEQKRIVSKLGVLSTKTKRLESNYQQKLADLGELKKSILQKAFDGEI